MKKTRFLVGVPNSSKRTWAGQPVGCQSAQLLIQQWQELARGVRIPLLYGGQDAGNVAHDRIT